MKDIQFSLQYLMVASILGAIFAILLRIGLPDVRISFSVFVVGAVAVAACLCRGRPRMACIGFAIAGSLFLYLSYGRFANAHQQLLIDIMVMSGADDLTYSSWLEEMVHIGLIVLFGIFGAMVGAMIASVLPRTRRPIQSTSPPSQRRGAAKAKTAVTVVVLLLGLSWPIVRGFRTRPYRQSVAATEQLGGEVRYYRNRKPGAVRELFDPQSSRDVRSVEFYRSHQVTNDDIARLKQFDNVQSLGLGFTQVTDQGLAHLRVFKNLGRINLQSTRITDAGLDHLSQIKTLRQLFLWDTDVTDAGVARLQTALPKCTIHHGRMFTAKKRARTSQVQPAQPSAQSPNN